MKLIDGFLSFIGFESNVKNEKEMSAREIQELKNKQLKKEEKLNKKHEKILNKIVKEKIEDDKDNISLNFKSIVKQENEIFFVVNNEEDIKLAVNTLRTNQKLYLDLSNLDIKLAERSIDFILGSLFVLNGSIERLSSNKFLLKI